MAIVISQRVRKKLETKHSVTEREIRQCFENLDGEYLADSREEHQTDPPTYWFVAETNQRRKLKILFVARRDETKDGLKVRIEIKSAFPPDLEEIELYELHGKC